ncbi:MAG: prophage regulatory protein [Granulosicoccus sp.]|jgi:prophage regulatory protein
MMVSVKTVRIMRPPEYRRQLGITKSGEYRARHERLLPPPIQLGPRSIGLPAHEVDIIIAARIAGTTDDGMREIVSRLVAARGIDVIKMLEMVEKRHCNPEKAEG